MAQPLKVTCPSCTSKFHIPLHLVRGKVVSFRCKKCRGTIPVDGRAITSSTPQPLPAPFVMQPDPMEAAESSYDEPSMRLSISDGIVVHEGLPQVAGLQADTPATFAHSTPPPVQRPRATFGASRTPPAGFPPALASTPPTAISRSTPPRGSIRVSEPPPASRPAQRGKKIIGTVSLAALAGLAVWSMSLRQAPHVATMPNTPSPNAPSGETRAAVKDPAPPPPHAPAVNAEAPATTMAAVKTEPKHALSIESLPVAAEPEPIKRAVQTARAKPAAAKASPETAATTDEPAVAAADTPAAAAPAVKEALEPGDFNKDAARQSLDDAGQRANSCRTVDTPVGVARVAVTFAPTGNVTAAVIESGPFVGTAAGGCVASKFRSARVPAFAGDPITVHKSFSF